MAVHNPEAQVASIVLLGNFNPAIFHPSWLSSHGMLLPSTAEKASIGVISPEVSSFTAEWLVLQVTHTRFQAGTADPRYFDSLRDLVLAAFTLLEFTPTTQMGINYDLHFPASLDFRNDFADMLVDRDLWKEMIDGPLMESLVIIGSRKHSPAKVFRVIVQPSAKVNPGIYIGFNEHFEAAAGQPPSELMGWLRSSWQDSLDHGTATAQYLLSKVKS